MTFERSDEPTSSTQRQPRGVHLVGSIPRGDAEDVFRAASSILSGRLRRIPDGEINFERLGYVDAAKAFYAVFVQLKQVGLIPARTRFQVSLPTPLAPVVAFIVPSDQEVVKPAYEAAMFAELDQIATTIPHYELAIQWDVAVEFGILGTQVLLAIPDSW
jgi:hypothetical protein